MQFALLFHILYNLQYNTLLYFLVKVDFFFCIFFYSGRDASHPEIFCFYYTVIIPAAPQETVRDAGIEPGTAALQFGVALAFSRLSHHIPKPPHPHPNLGMWWLK
jgi:hypothetical protein